VSADQPERISPQLAWRFAVAERVATAYVGNARLAAFTVAGSVGSGLADEFSDLELDCYWTEPPTDEDRRAPIVAAGGQLTDFWDYDPGDAEWSENYLLGRLEVTVSNFAVSSVERFIDAVTEHADTDPVKHMRLAAILRCRSLHGAGLIADWRDRASRYPDTLVAAMITEALTTDALPGWPARQALLSRGDRIALHELITGVERAVLGAVLAINRVYPPHRLPKWQRDLLAGLQVTPVALTERLDRLWAADAAAIELAEALLTETADLAESAAPVNLADFRALLAEQRRPLYPPAL
jgi:hypothetical protein